VTTLKPGDRIAERYVLGERIGEGGMGVVYAARDEKLRRPVAVKVLSPQRVGNKTARARLKREARAAAAFADPGIAQVFDVGETDDGGAFLVMELVRGESVRGKQPPGLPQAEALRIVHEVARTLDAAHKAELVHRDVKPDNIMIREDGRVVLLDFGIAKDFGQAARRTADEEPDSVVTAQGMMMGTPPYVAPEQIHAKGVGPASDQFALAVVAYGFLTGKRPWDAPTDLGVLGQILMEPPLPATSFVAGLPSAVDAVFARALAKEAVKRFPSVEAFADALESAVTGKELPAAGAKAAEGAPAAVVRPEKTPAPERTPTPERTPAPEKTPAPESIEVLLEAPVAVGEKTPAPEGFQRPVWKIRIDDEPPPPPSSTGRLVVAAVLIAVIAAAGGVWYGRKAAGPTPPGTGSGQGR
jgi:serine/threonine-protein kinase